MSMMSGNLEMNNALAASDAHPETMDFLSLAWCNFAVQALAPPPPPPPHHHLQLDPLPLHLASPKMEKSSTMDTSPDFTSLPPWNSNNDVKSWLRMQQAMHPELNYNTNFRKKWMPWKEMVAPLKSVSIKKWFKEIKQKRKEEQRLQRVEVHAAVSIAGVAAALAAIAADNNSKDKDDESNKLNKEEREAAIASAAALVASQCAKVAESMGANKQQLSNVIASAITSTTTSDILTFTAAAATSLKGAATLKARAGCNNNNRLINGGAPVLPIEDDNNNNKEDLDFDFEKGRYILAQGAEIYVESPEGKYMPRSVSVILDGRAKVVLIMRKHNLFKSKKESIVVNMHAEVYKGSSEGEDGDTCYLIVLTTSRGGALFKLDMATDFRRYKTWTTTINRMLKISTYHKYDLQYYS